MSWSTTLNQRFPQRLQRMANSPLVQCSAPDDPQNTAFPARGTCQATHQDVSNTFKQTPASYLDFKMLQFFRCNLDRVWPLETLNNHRACQCGEVVNILMPLQFDINKNIWLISSSSRPCFEKFFFIFLINAYIFNEYKISKRASLSCPQNSSSLRAQLPNRIPYLGQSVRITTGCQWYVHYVSYEQLQHGVKYLLLAASRDCIFSTSP